MEKIELIQKAIGANGFTTDDTSAGYVNPEYWNRRILEYEKANLVVTQFAKVYSDLLKDGDTLNVTVRSEPSAATAVAEDADVAVDSWSVSQVTFAPTEYAKAYQISDKERKRAFFSVMEAMAEDIGYALALAKDNKCVAELQANAGNAITANGTASGSLTDADTIDHEDVINAMKENANDKFKNPVALFVNPSQMADLMKDSAFLTADKFGDEAAVKNGFIGKVMGIPVYMTTQIEASSNIAKAILISSKEAFGIVEKPFEGIRMERHELGRYTDIVGVIDFDVKVLKPNSVCTIETYSA